MNILGAIIIGTQLALTIYLGFYSQKQKDKWIGLGMNMSMLFFWAYIWPALNQGH